MYSDKQNVLELIALLKAHNISRFVVSPGSRHIPIVISMENDPFFKLYSVVDERSASFFAIGQIQKHNEPVGIICTSGTAAANYCSGVSEAYYQRLPLLVITADRLDCTRDQQEDQQIHQNVLFKGIAKYSVNLPLITNNDDRWYCNRLINEALLELRHRGDGPVHINIPVVSHLDSFSTTHLPDARKITRNGLDEDSIFWNQLAKWLKGKKLIFIMGEGFPLNEDQKKSLDKFLSKYDCIVLADKMSNCHHEYAIQNSFPVIQAVSSGDLEVIKPDLIISCRANYSFNPEFKTLISRMKSSIPHWYVHPSGNIVDPFHTLTTVFEMDEFKFMDLLSNVDSKAENFEYRQIWKTISESIDVPHLDFCHVTAVGKLLQNLPNNSYLQMANSNSVRIAQFFDIDKSIEVHCNRGTDGIDGCMSTTVGFAADTDQLVFLIIGDLTFFYDMNALWNRHLGKNVRILLDNNGGGAIMHMPKRPDFAAKLLPNYISASHDASAKAWAIDRGFKYLSATNMEELEENIAKLTDINEDGPMILEVFTSMLSDTNNMKSYYASINREKLNGSLRYKSKQFAIKVLSALGLKDAIKQLLSK